MGVTMFWQQWMTPSTADPAQQKVMMFMPIMFTFMFLWAPSGLVVYWFVSNLFAIGQQYLTNRMIGAAPGRGEASGRKRVDSACAIGVDDMSEQAGVLRGRRGVRRRHRRGHGPRPRRRPSTDAGDHVRINLTGDDGEPLLRRKGEGLDALQHLVNSVFRHEADEKRMVVDCLDFRRAKDRELRQMVTFLIEKARTTGVPQEIGPLNSYSRRLGHLEVAEAGDMESESEGVGSTEARHHQVGKSPR